MVRATQQTVARWHSAHLAVSDAWESSQLSSENLAGQYGGSDIEGQK